MANLDDLKVAIGRVRDAFGIEDERDDEKIDTDQETEDQEEGEDNEEDEDDDDVYQKLQKLHRKIATHRILDSQDREYFLQKDLSKLKEMRATVANAELAKADAAKQAAVRKEAKELEVRRAKLKAKYSK